VTLFKAVMYKLSYFLTYLLSPSSAVTVCCYSQSVLSDISACCRVLDVVYIATINTTHVSLSLTMLAAGKHVVCEKPMSLTAAGAKKVLDFAQQQRLLYIEVIDGGFCFFIYFSMMLMMLIVVFLQCFDAVRPWLHVK